ncbi:Imm7 family immunity protein [Amycolatopsis sp. lyj-109]|uniref:Imm7 family immunity protein n=1 Tax=Amycolatopsis sp. lyj-109 TaxID=2789287 RepID=UPI00397AE227
MFEYHGWIALRPTAEALDDEPPLRLDEIRTLVAKVGRLAPGSYGLLYVHDDEHPEHRLSFRVFRLARGRVTEHADHLLSPVIPTLEDAETS